MQSLVTFVEILQHRSGDLPQRHRRRCAFGLLSAFMLVLGMVGRADGEISRYTLDDVMDKLDEMDKRLVRVETKVDMLEGRMDRIEGRMDDLESSVNGKITSLQTTMLSLFGLLAALFAGILAFVFSIARGLKPELPGDVMEELKRMRERMEEIAARGEALEEALAAKSQ